MSDFTSLSKKQIQQIIEAEPDTHEKLLDLYKKQDPKQMTDIVHGYGQLLSDITQQTEGYDLIKTGDDEGLNKLIKVHNKKHSGNDFDLLRKSLMPYAPEITAKFEDGLGRGVSGAFSPDPNDKVNIMLAKGRSPQQNLALALHENQHAVDQVKQLIRQLKYTNPEMYDKGLSLIKSLDMNPGFIDDIENMKDLALTSSYTGGASNPVAAKKLLAVKGIDIDPEKKLYLQKMVDNPEILGDRGYLGRLKFNQPLFIDGKEIVQDRTKLYLPGDYKRFNKPTEHNLYNFLTKDLNQHDMGEALMSGHHAISTTRLNDVGNFEARNVLEKIKNPKGGRIAGLLLPALAAAGTLAASQGASASVPTKSEDTGDSDSNYDRLMQYLFTKEAKPEVDSKQTSIKKQNEVGPLSAVSDLSQNLKPQYDSLMDYLFSKEDKPKEKAVKPSESDLRSSRALSNQSSRFNKNDYVKDAVSPANAADRLINEDTPTGELIQKYEDVLGDVHKYMADKIDWTKDKRLSDDIETGLSIVADPVNLVNMPTALGFGAVRAMVDPNRKKKDK